MVFLTDNKKFTEGKDMVLLGIGTQTHVIDGPYQDHPLLCPFRLLPLLIYSGSTIAFLKILKVQGPKSKNIENVILLQP